MLVRYAPPHRGAFARGVAGALVVVGTRLALPWPLHAALSPWVSGGSGPEAATPALAYGLVFLSLLVVLGLADHLERLWFARFSIGAIRDVRAAAFERAVPANAGRRLNGTGDVVARLIGDAARAKAGIKGFLVHVATNGVMYVGVVVVLLWMAPSVGGVFAATGLALAALTTWGAARAFDAAHRFRTKEGKLAESIQRAMREDPASASIARVNRSSGAHEATLTKVTGMATWGAHVLYGGAVLLALWLGMRAVAAGTLGAADMVAFFMYVLMMRAPVVQLVRQGTRTGKILACLERLGEVLALPSVPTASSVTAGGAIRLEGVLCRTSKASGRRRKLKVTELEVHPGERIAVVGKPGAGKTTLLRVVAGLERPGRGRVTWGGLELDHAAAAPTTAGGVGYLPEDPQWRRTGIRKLLGLPDGPATPEAAAVLAGTGADVVLARFRGGLDGRVGSRDLSPVQRRRVWLARVLLSGAPLLVLDDPVRGLNKKEARATVRAIGEAAGGATVVVTLSRKVAPSVFGRHFRLKRGRLIELGDLDNRAATESGAGATASAAPERVLQRTAT